MVRFSELLLHVLFVGRESLLNTDYLTRFIDVVRDCRRGSTFVNRLLTLGFQSAVAPDMSWTH